MKFPERARRALASVLQWGGWASALGIFAYATAEFDPAHGHIAPQWVGFAFIFSIGVAIAGATARSRMRLSDTIVEAFRAGFDASRRMAAAAMLAAKEEERSDE